MPRRRVYIHCFIIALLLLVLGCQSKPSADDSDKSIQYNSHGLYVELDDLNNDDNDLKKVEELQPIIRVVDVRTEEQTTIEVTLANQIYIAEDAVNKSNKIFMTDVRGPQLLDPFTGDVQPIQLETSKNDVNNRYNYYFPDTFFENTNYVIESLKTLYRYDNEGNKTAIWVGPNNQPIYGFAVSPHESRIAILISADNYIAGAKSDLIILDTEGKELMAIEQVAYTGKSDGVIPKIDLKWMDEFTLHIPTEIAADEGYEFGIRVITLKDEKPVITESIRSGWEFDSRVYPSPSGEHVVRVSQEEGIYFVPDKEDEKLLGKGYFLGWLDMHRIAWYESYNEEYPESTDIF